MVDREQSTDPDVVEEEQRLWERSNRPMAVDSAVEIRGLRATFGPFHAVDPQPSLLNSRPYTLNPGPQTCKSKALNVPLGCERR